jgi:hypothetical protein
MQEANNPVGKLLGYITKALEIPGNVATFQVWPKVLDCDQDDSRSTVQGLFMLMELSATAKKAIIDYVPGDKTLFLPPFDRVDIILGGHQPNQEWQTYKNYLDPATVSALQFGNYALGLAYPTASTETSAKISEFTRKLELLLSECLDSDLTQEIKCLFIRHLEAIRKSLLEYQVGGTADLEAVLDQAIGSMHRHVGAIEAQSENGLSIAKRVFETIANANEMITFSQSVLALAAPATMMLLPFLR